MLSDLRTRLTYANVMATVAVFIALGGSSYAALRITGKNVPKDALTGADIKNLTGRDVRNNRLTGADVTGLRSGDIRDRSLLAADFRAGELPPAFDASNFYDKGQSDARFQRPPTCPGGTAFHEGACIETSRREATTFSTAETVCTGAGNRRLPGPEELLGFRHRSGVDVDDSYEWATGLSFTGATVYANIVNDTQSNLSPYDASLAFRCVATPSG
jgi:hypothetical protein